MDTVSKERLLEWQQGLEVQLHEQEASLNATKGAIQMVLQLLDELAQEDKTDDGS